MADRIVDIMRANATVTMADIAQQLGVTQRTVERTVKKMRENGKVERVGGRRYGHWVINE